MLSDPGDIMRTDQGHLFILQVIKEILLKIHSYVYCHKQVSLKTNQNPQTKTFGIETLRLQGRQVCEDADSLIELNMYSVCL